MKKLIRVFIAVFCLFFALMAISGSNLPAITPYTQKIPEYMSRATLRLAESIDTLMGGRTGPDSHDSSPAAPGSSPKKPDTQASSGQDPAKAEKEQASAPSDSSRSTDGSTQTAAKAGTENAADKRKRPNSRNCIITTQKSLMKSGFCMTPCSCWP